jgi:hypothetical protein
VVNSYGSGCYNCGGWAAAGAAVTGAVVGATIASANNSAATANAYTQGYVAGTTTSAANAKASAVAVNITYSMGEIIAVLPSGCATPNVQDTTYYLCGNTWFSPSYGANGVYYRVVPTP